MIVRSVISHHHQRLSLAAGGSSTLSEDWEMGASERAWGRDTTRRYKWTWNNNVLLSACWTGLAWQSGSVIHLLSYLWEESAGADESSFPCEIWTLGPRLHTLQEHTPNWPLTTDELKVPRCVCVCACVCVCYCVRLKHHHAQQHIKHTHINIHTRTR